MSHFEGSQRGGWPQEVPEERPVVLPTWVQTNLEGEAGSPGRREWALTRRCDSAGCTGCGSPGFTQRCFLGARYLPKPSVPIRLAASRCSCRLGRGEGLCVAVTSSSGVGWRTGTCALSLLPMLPALPFRGQLFSLWRYRSPLFWWLHLKYLVADYAKYLLFITASFCVNAVSSLQYGFNISWILYVNCFQFSIASSLGPLQLNYCYSCPFVKCVMPVLIFLLSFI